MVDTPAPPQPKRRIGELGMVWRHAARYPGRIAIAGGALMVTSAATIAIPYGFKRVIDRGFVAGGDVGNAFHYLLMIVAVLAIATAIRFYFVSWLGERVVADIRTSVQRHLLTLSPRFFEENRPSEIASRMTSDTGQIEQIVGTTVSVALRNMFTGIGGVIYLFAISPKLAALLMLAIPAITVPLVVLGRRIRTTARTSQDRVADVGSMATETLGAMKIVQAFGQEDREAGRFRGAVEATMVAARQRILLRAIMTAIVIGLVFGSIAVETAAPEAVSSHPSSIGAVGSELRVGADAGAASRVLFGDRARSYPS